MHEFRLAHAAHVFWTIGAVEGSALCEHRLHDIVTRIVDVVGELFAQIDLLLEIDMRRRLERAQIP